MKPSKSTGTKLNNTSCEPSIELDQTKFKSDSAVANEKALFASKQGPSFEKFEDKSFTDRGLASNLSLQLSVSNDKNVANDIDKISN